MDESAVGTVERLARYPVKSMRGEHPDAVDVDARGVVGDREWAVYTADGAIGSGKTTRRFRRVDGLLALEARLVDTAGPPARGVPVISFATGEQRPADADDVAALTSDAVGIPVRLGTETALPHHDDAPVHLVTTAALRAVERLTGRAVDPERCRANILLDVPGTGFVEDDWRGRRLLVGQDVRLRLGEGMPRCVMVQMAQPGLAAEPGLLKALADHHDLELGLMASVEHGGRLRVGDVARLC